MISKEYAINSSVRRVSIAMRWLLADDDTTITYTLYGYDDSASLIKKVSSSSINRISSIDDDNMIKCQFDTLGYRCQINLNNSDDIIALLLVVDEKPIYNDNDTLIITVKNTSDYSSNETFFEIRKKFKNEFKKLFPLIFYQKRHIIYSDNEDRDILRDQLIWTFYSIYEPILSFAVNEVEDICNSVVIQYVPTYAKFKRKTFNDISEVCTALTTRDLLSFKIFFESQPSGLSLDPFTEIIFTSLATHHPQLQTENEACFGLALVQELFFQIDLNLNGFVSWSEFCDFCIAFSTLNQVDNTYHRPTTAINNELDEIVIKYEEDRFARDSILCPASLAVAMRHYPQLHRILVIQENTNDIFIFDEKYNLVSIMQPTSVVDEESLKSHPKIKSNKTNNKPINKPLVIHDALYIIESAHDIYIAYCSDDYTITITKERSLKDGKKKIYKLLNRIMHNLVHHKLCYSASNKVLCSIASNQQIYGWKLDKNIPLFQVTRHTDVVTAFINVDDNDLFITASMDKRIVLWSAYNQKVKGILEGHTRGVRCIYSSGRLLVSGSFDCDARLWDVITKECKVILRGHRKSITAVRIMDQNALSDSDIRIFTVDELGEFRMWAALSQERFKLAPVIPALQVFSMIDSQVPLNKIRFLAIIEDAVGAKSTYGRLCAIGSKLLSFNPLKKNKEFIPATCCAYVYQISYLLTAIGNGIIYYDISNGQLKHIVKDIWPAELTCFCFTGGRSRSLYIGCSDGSLLSYCFRSQALLGTLPGVCDKEVSCIAAYKKNRSFFALGSVDGSLRLVEETKTTLSSTYYLVTKALTKGMSTNASSPPIAQIQIVEDFAIAVVVSSTNIWGLWNIFSSSLSMIHSEEASLTGLKVITHDNFYFNEVVCRMITFCVSTTTEVIVYTVDALGGTIVVSFVLGMDSSSAHIHTLLGYRLTEQSYVNYECYDYQKDSPKYNIVACTDDGTIVAWLIPDLINRCEADYRATKMREGNLSYTGSDIDLLHLRSLARRRGSQAAIQKSFILGVGMLPHRFWKGHNEVIVSSVSLNESGCFITLSNDGFQRIWNLEGTCLGECLLPNVTAELKYNRINVYKSSKWLYRTETMPFTEWQKQSTKEYLATLSKYEGRLEDRFRELLSMAPIDETAAEVKSSRLPLLKIDDTKSETRTKALAEALVQECEFNNNLASIEVSLHLPLAQEMASISSSNKFPILCPTSPQKLFTTAPAFDPQSLFHPTPSRPATSSTAGKPLEQFSLLPSKPSRKAFVPEQFKKFNRKNNVLWEAPPTGAAAFSDSSLSTAYHSGLLDNESFLSLQNYGKAYGTKPGFNQTILLRNPSVVASVDIPNIKDIGMSELSFGTQKEMYKNANAQISKQKRLDSKVTQDLITLARIGRDIKQAKQNKMVAVVDLSLSIHDKGLFIEEETLDSVLLREQALSDIRLQKSRQLVPLNVNVAKLFDIDLIRQSMEDCAISSDNEIQREISFGFKAAKLRPKRLENTKKKISLDESRTFLEKKLQNAIFDYFGSINQKIARSDSNVKVKRKKLTTRDLLPFYRLQEVQHFLDIFTSVDSDANGALNIKEWISVFTELDSALPIHEIISMFDGVDTKMEGLLMLSDLIPMLFSKATREQKKMIQQYAESQIFSQATYKINLKQGDLQRLFECYDSSCVGFIPVNLVKERLHAMQFPVHIVLRIIDRFLGINNDEYLNLPEFLKLFNLFSSV